MKTLLNTSSRHIVLNPADRASEIITGLVMTVAVTGSVSVANAHGSDVQNMLIGAMGSIIASGFFNGIIFIFDRIVERARNLKVLRSMQKEQSLPVMREELDEILPMNLAEILSEDEINSIKTRLHSTLPIPRRAKLQWDDIQGAINICVLIVLATVPVALPFYVINNVHLALRVSHLTAIFLMFVTGFILGKYASEEPWRIGFLMLILGLVLVALTIALGG